MTTELYFFYYYVTKNWKCLTVDKRLLIREVEKLIYFCCSASCAGHRPGTQAITHQIIVE